MKADEFLQAIFRNKVGQAHVTSFMDDPSQISQERRAICWAGGLKLSTDLRAGENWYFCISLFSPDFMTGKAVRRKAKFLGAYAVVLDDVEEKLPIHLANRLPQPSYKLRTSNSSFQWGYILNKPEQSQQRIDNLTDQLIKNGLSPDGKDPGMRGVTRYVRIPGGYNTKSKRVAENGGTAPKCVLTEWNPDRKFTLEDLAFPFDVNLNAERNDSINQVNKSVPDHPILSMLHVKSEISPGRYDISCPWLNEHTEQEDSGTALFTSENGVTGFKCHHGHCEDRTFKDVLLELDKKTPGFYKRYKRWEALSAFRSVSTERLDFNNYSPHRKLRFRNVDFSTLPQIKWVINGFLPEGFHCFSGLPGIGKSTVFSSLAMVAAGFSEAIGADVVTDRERVVIYVSEDVDQLSRIFFGYCKYFNINPAALEARIKLVDARRCTVEELPLELNSLADEVSGSSEDRPLLIVDTASSVFELDNENDNSEVSKFIAAVKTQVFEAQGCPVWLITHAAKSSSRNSAEITPRGASAFIGDATGTGSIYEADGTKYFSIAKSRVSLDYTAIEFATVIKAEFINDERGIPQSQQIIISIPHQSSKPAQKKGTDQVKSEETLMRAISVVEYLKSQCEQHGAIAIKAGRGGSHSLPNSISAKVLKWSDIFIASLTRVPQTADEKLIKEAVLERYQPDERDNSGWHVWSSKVSNISKGYPTFATFGQHTSLN